MTSAELLAAAVRTVVKDWVQTTSSDQRLSAFEDITDLEKRLGSAVEVAVTAAGGEVATVRRDAFSAACTLLKDAFGPGELPETPQDFLYVPEVDGTTCGQAAALAAHGFLGLETVSYGSENDGALFVNLVPMPGQGRLADKSKDRMRGHTDAVSFPFNGEIDVTHPRIAPAPDMVTLVGMRNPNSVGTTVMPLSEILPQLTASEISELKTAQYSIMPQATFLVGIRNEFGQSHTLLDAALLRDANEVTHVRFSHRNVVAPDGNHAGEAATESFKLACEAVAKSVVVGPGDVLLVNNRTSLHGRGVVGEEVGGNARWLLRTYALNTVGLDDARRHLGDRPSHVLYP